MKNKIIPMAAMYLIVILLVICVLTVITEDRDAPRIFFGDEEMEYIEGDDPKVLLTNVSAVDEAEGDVSYTLTVESIRVLSSGRKVNVIYAARDSKNNIVKASRVMKYQVVDENEIPEKITDKINITAEVNAKTFDQENNAKVLDEEGTENIQDPENQEISQDEPNEIILDDEVLQEEVVQEEVVQEETEEGLLVSVGDPIIKLNTHSVTITAGEYFNIMNYIEQAVDDEDDAWRRIYINGNYSSKIPGKYSIRFSITDSDGNTSNVEKLTLIVQ